MLDADDYFVPAALRLLREPLDRDPGLGFTYGIAHFFGDWEGDLRFPPYDPYKLIYRHIIGSTALMRRELFEQVGGFDPDITGYEDWDFWLGALGMGWRGQNVDAVTFMYRRHGSTMYTGARAQYRKWYRLLQRKHRDLYASGRAAAACRRVRPQPGWKGGLSLVVGSAAIAGPRGRSAPGASLACRRRRVT